MGEILSSFAVVKEGRVTPYWKMPEYYEVLLRLQPRETTRSAYDAALQALGEGWQSQGELENIWTPDAGGSFSLEEVKWAHLEGLQSKT
jgi:hypothetical protein